MIAQLITRIIFIKTNNLGDVLNFETRIMNFDNHSPQIYVITVGATRPVNCSIFDIFKATKTNGFSNSCNSETEKNGTTLDQYAVQK